MLNTSSSWTGKEQRCSTGLNQCVWGVQRLRVSSVTSRPVAYYALEGGGGEGPKGHLHPWLTTVSCGAAWLNTPVPPKVHILHFLPVVPHVPATPAQDPTARCPTPGACSLHPISLLPPLAQHPPLHAGAAVAGPNPSTAGTLPYCHPHTLVDPDLWAMLRFQPFCFYSALRSAGLFTHFHSFCLSSHNLINAVIVCFENQYLIFVKVYLQRKKWESIDRS